jgi:hypothetical protein
MSPVLANTVASALYAGAVLPLIAAMCLPRAQKIIFVFAACVIGLIALQTGVFHRSALTPTNIVTGVVAQTHQEQCVQIVDLMQQSGLSFDLTDRSTPRIVGNNADQIPSELLDSLLACSNHSLRDD